MTRIFIPSLGPSQWRALLGDPKKHWKRTRSAFETAVSWEVAQHQADGRGLPREIAKILDGVDCLKNAELLFAVPEHKVKLNSAKAPSQNDVWALLKNEQGLISLTVEAKAGEEFDKTVTGWLNKDEKRQGRIARLKWLCDHLKSVPSEEACALLRYQLFHRTVSALKEAQRFNAFAAVVLIQAFPGAETSEQDFKQFGKYLGMELERDRLVQCPTHQQPGLFIGWVSSRCATPEECASSLVEL